MKRLMTILTIAIISLTGLCISAATKIAECEDELGQRSFQSSCPPGFTTVGEKEYSTGAGSDQKTGTTNISVTLYRIPECELCDDVKEFLVNRKISITEKDVTDDVALQEELKEKSGGLRVPVVVIGEQVLTGYQRSTLLSALEAVGYAEDKADAEDKQ